jgi:uncharacterized protein (TIGR03437 family)
VKAIFCTAALFISGAIPGFCQAPHRSLASLFNSKLAFYLPARDSAPISTEVVNTAGGTPTIAPNTWLEIHGSNLSPTTQTWSSAPSFQANPPTMPLSLGGVSATINNKPAAIYYISPTQINVLAPLDTATGAVPVQVTTPSGTTPILTPTEQSISPGFLVIDVAGHVAARHIDYSLLGPAASSVPGYTFTPAKPGETVLLYSTGFGQTNPPITDQLNGQGPLPTLPLVSIGNIPATVSFAGLSGAGLYQFNVVVPTNAPDGDLTLLAIYNGVSTQNGVVITVQH